MKAAPIPARTTDPILLERVRDWRDLEAWAQFVHYYDPHLRAICRRYGLRGECADDACQAAWIKLAGRLRRFQYDPGARFRGWLHRFFQRSVLDSIKAGGAMPPRVDLTVEEIAEAAIDEPATLDPTLLAMLRRAEEVQQAARSRVKPENWEAYRMIAIDGLTVAEAADLVGRPYMTVYRAYQRAKAIIDEERGRVESGPSQPA